MRKATAVILSLFYLLIAADASVAIHKCMGSIESIDLVQTAEVCCCGDMNIDSCCENETVDLPQDQEEKVVSHYSFSFENNYFQVIEVPSLLILERNNPDQLVFGFTDVDPPSHIPAYVKYCSFTFYG